MRTVVFDLGGVLVPSSRVVPLLAADLGVTEAEFAAAYWPPRQAYDLGGSASEYWGVVVTALGRDAEPDLLRGLEQTDSDKWSTLPPESVALLDQLRDDGERLTVLSNAPAPLAVAVRAAAWSDLMERLLFSAEIGVMKPDPAVYVSADAAFGTVPGDVVFFDDRADNVAAARDHGWDAHLWCNPETALQVLSAHSEMAGRRD